MQSENINELAAALAKAQGQLKPAKADSKNDHYKSEYSSLKSMREACKEPLASNGLSLSHNPIIRDGGMVMVSKLLHSSGQWISSELPLIPEPQAAGSKPKSHNQLLASSITYMCRYAIGMMIGVVTENDPSDDDANPSDLDEPKNEVREQSNSPRVPPSAGKSEFVSEAQGKMLFARMNKLSKENQTKFLNILSTKGAHDVNAAKWKDMPYLLEQLDKLSLPKPQQHVQAEEEYYEPSPF